MNDAESRESRRWGWESIVYIVILAATYFQETTCESWWRMWGGQPFSCLKWKRESWSPIGRQDSHQDDRHKPGNTKKEIDAQLKHILKYSHNSKSHLLVFKKKERYYYLKESCSGGSYSWRNLPCQYRVPRVYPGEKHNFSFSFPKVWNVWPSPALVNFTNPAPTPPIVVHSCQESAIFSYILASKVPMIL